MGQEKEKKEVVYGGVDVANLLHIQESTVRKYALMMEDHGYKFYKNDHSHRGYYDKDVIAMRKLIQFKNHPNMTLKQACNALMTWLAEEDKAEDDIAVGTSQERDNREYNQILQELEAIKKQQEKQEEFNALLIQQLKRQQEHLDQNHQALVEIVKEKEEQKQLVAASQEEETPPLKKKSWLKFWK